MMLREEYSKLAKFSLITSTLLLLIYASKAIFGEPKSDFFFVLQKMFYFIMSLVASGTLLAYSSKNLVHVIILLNIVLLIVLFVR